MSAPLHYSLALFLHSRRIHSHVQAREVESKKEMVLDIGLPHVDMGRDAGGLAVHSSARLALSAMRSSRTWPTSGQASVHDKLLEEVQNQLVELKGLAERNTSSESGGSHSRRARATARRGRNCRRAHW